MTALRRLTGLFRHITPELTTSKRVTQPFVCSMMIVINCAISDPLSNFTSGGRVLAYRHHVAKWQWNLLATAHPIATSNGYFLLRVYRSQLESTLWHISRAHPQDKYASRRHTDHSGRYGNDGYHPTRNYNHEERVINIRSMNTDKG